MKQPARLTTDEYLAGEETLLPQELIWGVVRDAPTPHPRHRRAVFRLAELIGGSGEGTQIRPDRVSGPPAPPAT